MSIDILSTLQRLLRHAAEAYANSIPSLPPTTTATPNSTSKGLSHEMIQRLPLLMAPCTNNEPCPICLTTISPQQMIRLLPCSHYYHPSCIGNWLSIQNTCPSCRYPVDRAILAAAQGERNLLFETLSRHQSPLMPMSLASTGGPARRDGDGGVHDHTSSGGPTTAAVGSREDGRQQLGGLTSSRREVREGTDGDHNAGDLDPGASILLSSQPITSHHRIRGPTTAGNSSVSPAVMEDLRPSDNRSRASHEDQRGEGHWRGIPVRHFRY